MGDHGVVEVALLVVRDSVRLGIALLVGRPYSQRVLSKIGFPVELEASPGPGYVGTGEARRLPLCAVSAVLDVGDGPCSRPGAAGDGGGTSLEPGGPGKLESAVDVRDRYCGSASRSFLGLVIRADQDILLGVPVGEERLVGDEDPADPLHARYRRPARHDQTR